jgi:sec-independent protein translocase protein TatA
MEGFFSKMTLLFLNSIGTGEMILILFVVLMLFGSKSIPSLAKTLGKGMREIKTASNEIKRDLQNSALEMRKDLNIENPLDDIIKTIEKPNEIKDFKEDNPETTLKAPSESAPLANNKPTTDNSPKPE